MLPNRCVVVEEPKVRCCDWKPWQLLEHTTGPFAVVLAAVPNERSVREGGQVAHESCTFFGTTAFRTGPGGHTLPDSCSLLFGQVVDRANCCTNCLLRCSRVLDQDVRRRSVDGHSMLVGPDRVRPVRLSSPERQVGGMRDVVVHGKTFADEVESPLRVLFSQLPQYGAVSFGIEHAPAVPGLEQLRQALPRLTPMVVENLLVRQLCEQIDGLLRVLRKPCQGLVCPHQGRPVAQRIRAVNQPSGLRSTISPTKVEKCLLSRVRPLQVGFHRLQERLRGRFREQGHDRVQGAQAIHRHVLERGEHHVRHPCGDRRTHESPIHAVPECSQQDETLSQSPEQLARDLRVTKRLVVLVQQQASPRPIERRLPERRADGGEVSVERLRRDLPLGEALPGVQPRVHTPSLTVHPYG